MKPPIQVVLALTVLCVGALRAAAQCGVPPTDFCETGYQLSGQPGTQEVLMDVSTATGTESLCGIAVGHSVWFKVVPSVAGTLTFTTCHPNTTYDTVIRAYTGSDCEVLTPMLDCVDDTHEYGCSNGCSAYGSSVRFSVTPGQLYRFVVGSYNNNSAGCNLCLGVRVTLCPDTGTAAPSADISSPAALACVCGAVPIYGSVSDTSTGIREFRLEWRAVATAASWVTITSGHQNVFGLLGTWYTGALPQGYYYLRLTAENHCGATVTALQTVFLDAGFDSLELRAPAANGVLGGMVRLDGTVWDHCGAWYTARVRPIGGAFQPVDPANPQYNATKLNDPLADWNTRAGVADGNYELELRGTDPCGQSDQALRTVIVDNTPPSAYITAPGSCTRVDGVVPIIGTATDAHLGGWTLQYTGGDAHGWVTIHTSTAPVVNGLLANWDTSGLRACAYTIRLVAWDTAVVDSNGAIQNRAEYETSLCVRAQCTPLGDLNCDGYVNNFDIDPFVLALTDEAAYELSYPECYYTNADANGDGRVNNFDIDGFVQLLVGAV
ncbi:MAG: hypothetical protein AB7Q17_12855 [Phycisphaerae bacterium]